AWDGRNWPLIRKPGAFSENWSLLIDTRPPPAPSFSPAVVINNKPYAGDGMISRDNKLYIHWNRVTDISLSPTGETAGTAFYEVWIDNDNDFSSIDYIGFSPDNIFNYADDNWPAATGFPEDNYSFKVFAWDAAGNKSESSPIWTFIVDITPPPAPDMALARPENNGAENNVSAEFVVVHHDWLDVYDSSGIDHYEIQVDNEPTYSDPCPPPGIFGSEDFNNISSSTITIYYPQDGKYWWRVRAVDRSGLVGEWSDNLVFIVDRVPPHIPTPLLPLNGITTSDNTPYFTWENVLDNTDNAQDVSGLHHFDLEISDTPSFATISYRKENIYENWFTLPAENSLSVGTWYWRVRAVDRAGNASKWSENFAFRVNDLQISVFLSDNSINPGQVFTISGRASWQPDNYSVDNRQVELRVDDNLISTTQTDENGNYSFQYSTTSLGTHQVKVSVVDNDNTYEENTITFRVERLWPTIRIFYTPTMEEDYVVNPGDNLTISGIVRRAPDYTIESGAKVYVYLNENLQATTTSGADGSYSITLLAPENLGNNTIRVYAIKEADGIEGDNTRSFTVKTVYLTFIFERTGTNEITIPPNTQLLVSGSARLMPENLPVEGENVEIWLGEAKVTQGTTDAYGRWSAILYAPANVGTYIYTARIVDYPDKIRGSANATMKVRVLDISMNYEDNIANPSQPNTLWGYVVLRSENENTPVGGVTVYFDVYDQNNNPVPGSGGSGVSQENGYYSIPFTSPSYIGTFMGIASATYGVFTGSRITYFYVKTLHISLKFDDGPGDYDDNIVLPTQDFKIYGTVTLLPDNTPVDNVTVYIKRDGLNFDTTTTNENGDYSYIYTLDAAKPEKHSITVSATDPEGITRENTQYFEHRLVVYTWFGTYDNHQQLDSIVNPGETFYPAVRIMENNGEELFPVTTTYTGDPLTMTVTWGGQDTTKSLIPLGNGYWRFGGQYTAPTTTGNYSFLVDITGQSGHKIYAIPTLYDQPVQYSVKTINLHLWTTDNVVNPGQENVLARGTLTLLPDGTPIDNTQVKITYLGAENWVTTDATGSFSLPLPIPQTLGTENVDAWVTDNRGLVQENRISIHIKTIYLTLVPEAEVAPEMTPFTFTGRATLLPDNAPVANNPVDIYVGENKTTVYTADNGYYSYTHIFPKRGIYLVRATITNPDNIVGENSREMIAGRPITIKGEVKSLDGTPVATTFTFYEVGTTEKAFEFSTDAQGKYYKEVFAGYFDLEVSIENIYMKLKFENFNMNDLPMYTVIENFVMIDTPPPAFMAIPATHITLLSGVVKLHQMFTDNFNRLLVTFNYKYPVDMRWVGDIWNLRLYASDNWVYENRTPSLDWVQISEKEDINIIQYTITADDNTFSLETAYALAEFDPLASVILQFQEAVQTMQQSAQELLEAAGKAENAAATLENIVSGLATQENVKNLMELQQLMLELQENFLQMQNQLAQMQENTTAAITTIQQEIDNIIAVINNIISLVNQIQSGQMGLASLIENISFEVSGLAQRVSSLEQGQNTLKQDLDEVYNKLIAAYKMIEENIIPKQAITVKPESIVLEIHQEKYADAILEVTSQVFTELQIQISISSGIQKFLPSPYTYSITLGPREVTNLSFRFSVGTHERLGVNTGEIRFSNATTGEVYKVVPVTVYVLPMARGMFDVSVVAPDQIKPGSSTTAQVILTNKGAMDSDVVVSMWLVSPTGENIFIEEKTTKVPAGDSRTMDFTVDIPENALDGNYTLLAIAEYPINGETLTVRGRTAIRVGEPGQRVSILGLSPWMFGLLIAALIASGISSYFGYKYYRKRLLAKKRFLGTIFHEELPKPGPDSIKLGQLAEIGGDAHLRLEDLRMHTITAGATGGGKTISSMVI
ncbi:MAG: hypothetical protein ACK4GQ_01480, partial [Candidatus Hadarchaeales archaeon]